MALVRLETIRVVVFDLDDTLYPERAFAMSGFVAVGRWLTERVHCPIDATARMQELFETGHRGHVFDQLLAELGVEAPESLVPQMIEHYRSHWPNIRLDEAAERAIKRWSGSCKLGLISDGPLLMQQRKVEALGLAPRLDRIILTDAWGRAFWKPHVRAFETIEQAWGHQGPACVYIADNPSKDFVAPKKLGWRTVRLRRSSGIYADATPGPGGTPELEVTTLDSIDIKT